MKRVVSLILVVAMVIGILPIGEIVAYAEDVNPAFVRSITVTKNYTDFYGPNHYLIEIAGSNFKDSLGKLKISVGLPGESGKIKEFEPVFFDRGIVQYELSPSQIDGEIYVEGQKINISTDDMPSISSREPDKGIVKSDSGKVTINGSNFDKIATSGGIRASFYQGNTTISISKPEKPDKIETDVLKGKTGTWGIIFEQDKDHGDFDQQGSGGKTKISLHMKNRYLRMFTLLQDLNVSVDKVEPTRGPLGSEVRIIGDSLKNENEMSVFFVKSIDGRFPIENMSKVERYMQNENGKSVFTVEVPKSLKKDNTNNHLGDYYIVITNNVGNNENPDEKVVSYKVLDEKFTVIDENDGVKLMNPYIDPDKGSANGNIPATVYGRYIGSMIDNLYSLNKNNGSYEIKSPDGGKELEIEYTGGLYKNKYEVETLTRKVKILIGDEQHPVTFENGSSINPNGRDEIKVIIPPTTTEKEKPKRDVIVIVESEVTYIDDDGNERTEIIGIERDVVIDGFEYTPIDYNPQITQVVPDKIPVGENGETELDITMYIYGKNFVVHKYIDENKEEKYKYPIIDLGGQIILDKNNDESVDIKIFNDNDEEVDGTEGNNLGTKIIVKVPEGKKVRELGKKDLIVQNPILNSDSVEYKDGRYTNMGSKGYSKIEFLSIDIMRRPKILTIEPRIINIDDKQEVVIEGFNFARDVKVYVNGKEVTRVNRNILGTELKFMAPENLPGTYQLIVQNENGGTDTDELIYVKTDTDPSIISFTPKSGTNGTTVYIKGNGLIKPNPYVHNTNDKVEIFNFIGTRVLLKREGTNKVQDMNIYNHKNNNENDIIELIEFNKGKDLVTLENNKLVLSDYSHSIIFESETANTNKFYKIHEDDGKIILTDGVNDEYTLYYNGGYKANKAGQTFDFVVNDEYLIIKQGNNDVLKLRMKTPYKMDGEGNIVGNKVKVINDKEIIFDVNVVPEDIVVGLQNGFYEVIIENPGPKRVTAKEKFEFIAQPESKPEITGIEPTNEGSQNGDYKRIIRGKNFQPGMSVSIGDKDIKSEDIEFISSEEIIIKIPKYDGNLSTENSTGRKKLPITIVNPDGGTASFDFIYVNPKSRPVIDSVAPNFGPISGGTEITIYEGKEFRFYEPYEGNTRPEGHIDLTNPEHRNKLGGSIKEDASEDGWAKQLEILPTIYIDGKEATILRYDTDGRNSSGKRTITVEAPKGKEGKVKIQLENNDFGISNEIEYEYTKSNIGKVSIKPDRGTKLGKNNAEIRPENKELKPFIESNINIYKDNGNVEKKKLQLVRFGNENDLKMSNKSIDGNMQSIEKDNSGRIVNGYTNVSIGNLKVNYNMNNTEEKLLFEIVATEYDSEKEEYKDVVYKFEADFPKGENEVYLPISILKNGDKNYNGFELVKISKSRFTIGGSLSNIDKLIVERGYSPESIVKNKGEYIDLKVPSYYTIGKVKVKIINADGGETDTEYTYTNPVNNPSITDMYRSDKPTTDAEKESGEKVIKVDYKGGAKIHIEGKEFRKPSKIDIGPNLPIEDIEHLPEVEDKEDHSELIFTMPEVPESYVGNRYAVIVTTPYEGKDGLNSATVSSAEGEFKIYIEFTKGESFPKITKLNPATGPASGGTKVTIEGEDFRQKKEEDLYDLRVLVDGKEISKDNFNFVTSKKIIITTPPHNPGLAKIEVINPDGTHSTPDKAGDDIFQYVSEPKITSITPSKVKNDGGHKVTIKGTGFMEGVKVIIGKEDENLNPQETKFINSETIEILSPAIEMHRKDHEISKDVTIKNEDGGTDKKENGLTFTQATPDTPTNFKATPGYERSMTLTWDKVEGTHRYKIFAKLYSDKDDKYEYLGETSNLQYIVKDLQPDTRYSFRLWAVNEYGESKSEAETNARTLTKKDDKGDDKYNNDTESRKNTETLYSSGEIIVNLADDYSYNNYNIDLTDIKYKDYKNIRVVIPISAVNSARGNATIKMQDTLLDIPLGIFNTRGLSSGKDRNVIVELSKLNSQEKGQLTRNLARGTKAITDGYEIKYTLQDGRQNTEIEPTGTMYITSYIDRPTTGNIYTAKYIPSTNSLSRQVGTSYTSSVRTNIYTKGRYIVLEER